MFELQSIEIQNRQIAPSKDISSFCGADAQNLDQTREDNPVSRNLALISQGKRSMRAAINAMCAHCVGCTASDQGEAFEDWIEPGFRKEIRQCSAFHCALWVFRPFQRKE
ncbi:hypothetical protein [Marinihelvus fidelis]|uniref:hypothetical protein n=1 Tax=Marinihelvus fidelis TaxID=2613842 RepID=UPI0017828CF8|nr:hypothetical protein [Marinihelvus fidelis]